MNYTTDEQLEICKMQKNFIADIMSVLVLVLSFMCGIYCNPCTPLRKPKSAKAPEIVEV